MNTKSSTARSSRHSKPRRSAATPGRGTHHNKQGAPGQDAGFAELTRGYLDKMQGMLRDEPKTRLFARCKREIKARLPHDVWRGVRWVIA